MKDIEFILGINLQLFAVQVTTQTSLSDEMKTFYDMNLIDYAQANLVHDQFAQKRPIPQNGGKTIEFRIFADLEKSLTPITEGVTPDGNSLDVSKIEATVAQYGDYVVMSDVLELTAIDNVILEATRSSAVRLVRRSTRSHVTCCTQARTSCTLRSGPARPRSRSIPARVLTALRS